MDHQRAWELLSDYVDRTLSAAQMDAVARHVESCETCRAEVDELHALIARAGRLSRSVEPPRDLWPGITAAIADRQGEGAAADATGRSGPGALWSRWREVFGARRWLWPSVAATAAVAALAAILVLQPPTGDTPMAPDGKGPAQMTAQKQGSSGPAVEGEALAPDVTAINLVLTLEAETRGGQIELAQMADNATCDESRSIMESIAHEIQTIDLAITEAKDAWTSDPNSPGLARLLASYYRAKAALQGRATEVAARVSC